MDFAGESAEHRDLRAAVAAIASGFGPKYYLSMPPSGTPCDELWAELGEAGFLGVNVPAEYGGGGGGITELAIVCEELAAAGCPLLLLVVSPAIAADDPRRARHRRAAASGCLPGIADGTHEDGLRDHRAGRRLEHAPARHHRPPATVTAGVLTRHASTTSPASTRPTPCWSSPAPARRGRTARLRPSLFLVPTDAPGLESVQLEMDDRSSPEKQFTAVLRRRAGAGRRADRRARATGCRRCSPG